MAVERIMANEPLSESRPRRPAPGAAKTDGHELFPGVFVD
jgi:hypothetical protein